MTDPPAFDPRCSALRASLLEFTSPPAPADEPAFYSLFSQILSVCSPLPATEDAAELLLLAYAMHPKLHDDQSILDDFLRIAERCWRTGVSADFAYIQVGYYWMDLKRYDRALACFEAARPDELNPYWGGLVLDYRLGCLVRLGRIGQAVRPLADYLEHYERYGDKVEDSLALAVALGESPDALRDADPQVIDLLQRLGRFARFKLKLDAQE